MSVSKKSGPAKLVIGTFMQDKDTFTHVLQDLVDKFGPTDIISSWLPFNFTKYYTSEMGESLFRRMISFKSQIRQTDLSDIKKFSNSLELKYSKHSKRKVNIDPGYMLLERFVLATGKNFTHRICISDTVYADLTLIFQKGKFQTLPWTYPDYTTENMLAFLYQVRNKLNFEFKKGGELPLF